MDEQVNKKIATTVDVVKGYTFAAGLAVGVCAATGLLIVAGLLVVLAWAGGTRPVPLQSFDGSRVDLSHVSAARTGSGFEPPYDVELEGGDAAQLASLIGRREPAHDVNIRREPDSRSVIFLLDAYRTAYVRGWIVPSQKAVLFEEVEGNALDVEPLGYSTVTYKADDVPVAAWALFEIREGKSAAFGP